ncbi:MAG: hypothetical protein A2007_06380 [Verrucomicrobia bacterium GWC2_42_7]|nr:MAG: hypothetical protein A2007_06380 [Verrucomicrobia bacterium GWC2_42_7]
MRSKSRYIVLLLSFLFIGLQSSFASSSKQAKNDNTLIGKVLPKAGVYIDHIYNDKKYQINLRINNDSSKPDCVNRFELYFIDESGKVVKPIYDSAFIRYSYNNSVDESNGTAQNFISLSNKGEFLTDARIIRPPHFMFVNIIFRTEKGDVLLNRAYLTN